MGKRDATYEFIRVMSMAFAVSVHACSNAAGNYLVDTLTGQLVGTLLYLCNGLFFMISGKFALSTSFRTMEDYRKYYLKRLGSIGIPVMVCMLLRSMFNIGWWPEYFLSADFLKEYLQNGVLPCSGTLPGENAAADDKEGIDAADRCGDCLQWTDHVPPGLGIFF